MICKVLSRSSKNRYRVKDNQSGSVFSATGQTGTSYNPGDYVTVSDRCILSKTASRAEQSVIRV